MYIYIVKFTNVSNIKLYIKYKLYTIVYYNYTIYKYIYICICILTIYGIYI